MAIATVNLPKGFVLDEKTNLPDGFVLDSPAETPQAPAPVIGQAEALRPAGIDVVSLADREKARLPVVQQPIADPKDIEGFEVQPAEVPAFRATPERTLPEKIGDFFIGKPEDRPFLPTDAGRAEKVDHTIRAVASMPVRALVKFGKGILLGTPDLAWATIKKIIPEDAWTDGVENMTLDQAMDWAMGYNPSGFSKFISGAAEFYGGFQTVKGLVPTTPKSATVVDKALRTGNVFALAKMGRELSKFGAELIDPQTDYQYEGAPSVLIDFGVGAGFSLLGSASKPVLNAIAKTPAAKAISDAAHRVVIELTKRFPVLADTVRKNPSAYFLKQILRSAKNSGIDTKNLSIKQKAVLKHVAREAERRFAQAMKNYTPPADIVRRGPQRRGLQLAEPLKPRKEIPHVQIDKERGAAPRTRPRQVETQPRVRPAEDQAVVQKRRAAEPQVRVSPRVKEAKGAAPTEVAPALREELVSRKGAFAAFKKSLPNATEKEIIIAMIKDGLRPPNEVLKRHPEIPQVQDILARKEIDRIARKPRPKKPAQRLADSIGKSVFVQGKKTFKTKPKGESVEVKPDIAPVTSLGKQVALPPSPVETPQKPSVPETKFRPGQTSLVSDTVAETVAISKDLADTTTKSTGAALSLITRNVKRGEQHIETLGFGGKQLASDIEQVDFRVHKRTNNDTEDLKHLYKKTNHGKRVQISKVVNGIIPPSEVSESIVKKAQKLRVILDRSMLEANALGVLRDVGGKKLPVGGSGKAYPQVLNRAGKRLMKELDRAGASSQFVMDTATKMIAQGQAKDIATAVTRLQQFREQQLRGINPYLETSRIELPEEFIDWDGANSLPRLLKRNWMTVEGIRQWGFDKNSQSFPKANRLVERIRTEKGVKEADRTKNFIEVSFGQQSRASAESQFLAQKARDYQFITKIAESLLTIQRNMLDRLPKGMTVGGIAANIKATRQFPPFINAFMKGSQRIQEDMIRTGAIFGHSALAEDFEQGTQIKNILALPFSSSELGNQVYIALVKKLQLEHDLQQLMKAEGKSGRLWDMTNRIRKIIGNSVKQRKNRLRELGNDELVDQMIRSGELKGELLDAVLFKTVRNRAFPVTLSTKRIWWDNHPWFRVAAQFKTWPIEQTQHIYNDVLKYTLKTGDISRLLKWLVATALVGEIYNILRDFILDKDESIAKKVIEGRPAEEVAIAAMKDFLDGGGIGILADFSYGFTDWLLGPSVSTANNFRKAVSQIYKEPKETPAALRKLIERETSPIRQIEGIINRVDRSQLNKNNISKGYNKWRSRGYDWLNKKKTPTEKILSEADDFLFGKQKFRSSSRTLSLEMAARQVIVGDIEDASRHLRIILEQAKAPGDKKKIVTGIKQSARIRSPLGRVAKKDRKEFLGQFSAKEQQEVKALEKKWFDLYERAFDLAIEKQKKPSSQQNLKDVLNKAGMQKLSGLIKEVK